MKTHYWGMSPLAHQAITPALGFILLAMILALAATVLTVKRAHG